MTTQRRLACLLVLGAWALHGTGGAQEFRFVASGPELVTAAPESMVRFDAAVLLVSEGVETSFGAQGWSIGVAASGGRIVAATTDDTDAALLRTANGFEVTQLTTGRGNEGAVSGVVLSVEPLVTLPTRGSSSVLRLEIEAAVPPAGCTPVTLRFVDGLEGAGEPVANTVFYGGDSLPAATTPTATSVCAAAPDEALRRGDFDGNGAVNLADAIACLEFLFRSGAAPLCPDAADANDDGEIDAGDPVFLLDSLFRSPGALPLPGAVSCGVDPTVDELPPCSGGCGERRGRAA